MAAAAAERQRSGRPGGGDSWRMGITWAGLWTGRCGSSLSVTLSESSQKKSRAPCSAGGASLAATATGCNRARNGHILRARTPVRRRAGPQITALKRLNSAREEQEPLGLSTLIADTRGPPVNAGGNSEKSKKTHAEWRLGRGGARFRTRSARGGGGGTGDTCLAATLCWWVVN
jgi:hypothetical protein